MNTYVQTVDRSTLVVIEDTTSTPISQLQTSTEQAKNFFDMEMGNVVTFAKNIGILFLLLFV